MTARNDITGDAIATKAASDAYRDNFDMIFRKSKPKPSTVVVEVLPSDEEKAAKELRKEQTNKWWKYCEENQKVLEVLPSFEEFRTNILPNLV